MAFTAKILSWRFRHLNIVGCLLKRRPTKGGHGHPSFPPSYAPAMTSPMSSHNQSGAPNENIVQNHLNIALLNVF